MFADHDDDDDNGAGTERGGGGHSDEKIWEVIRKVRLEGAIATLDQEVSG